MNYKQLLNCLLVIMILMCALINIQAHNTVKVNPNPPGENVVFQWNRVLQETVRTPGQQPATFLPCEVLR